MSNEKVKNLKNKFKSHYSRYIKSTSGVNSKLTSDMIENSEEHKKELMILRDALAKAANELKNMLNALKELNLYCNEQEILQLIDDQDFLYEDTLSTAYLLTKLQYYSIDFTLTGNQQSQLKSTRIINENPNLKEILQEFIHKHNE